MTSHQRERRLPWLLLYVFIVATVGRHAKLVKGPLDTHANKRSKIHAVDLLINVSVSKYSEDVVQYYDSFFDCHSKKSTCRYLRPGEFFKHYFSSSMRNTTIDTNSIEDTQRNSASEHLFDWRSEIGLENENMPALTSLSWWWDWNVSSLNSTESSHQSIDRKIDEHIAFPRNLTYIHVHKCGGTSIQSALSRRASEIGNTRFHIQTSGQLQDSDIIKMHSDVHHYKHSYGGGSSRMKEKWDKQRINHIEALNNRLMNRTVEVQDNRTVFPIFTILRDPIERFFSAVQQVMHYNVDFRAKCLREPSVLTSEKLARASRRETIQCAIDDMKETNYRKDVHLLPMSSHFRLLDGNAGDKSVKDVRISVFYMDYLTDVLNYISGVDGKSVERSNLQSTVIHTRDRTKEDYATSPILAKLSIDDCSEEMIQKICTLYKIDFSLLKWLGFGDNAGDRCKGYASA